jgi:6-methylsalicylate decarboxylase
VARKLQRLNYDTANATGSASMASVLKLLPISQIVFGSDYPYLSTGPQIEELQNGELSSEELQAILFNNPRVLLNR